GLATVNVEGGTENQKRDALPPQARHQRDPPVAHLYRLEPGDEARGQRLLVEILRQVPVLQLPDDPPGEGLSFDGRRSQRDDQHTVLQSNRKGGRAVEPAVRIPHPLQRNRQLGPDLPVPDREARSSAELSELGTASDEGRELFSAEDQWLHWSFVADGVSEAREPSVECAELCRGEARIAKIERRRLGVGSDDPVYGVAVCEVTPATDHNHQNDRREECPEEATTSLPGGPRGGALWRLGGHCELHAMLLKRGLGSPTAPPSR